MKKLFVISASAAAAIPAAQGQITFYDFGDQAFATSLNVFLDFDTGSLDDEFFSGSDMFFTLSAGRAEFPAFTVNGPVSGSTWRLGVSSADAKRYYFGDSLTFAEVGTVGYLERNNIGSWEGLTGAETTYIGLTDLNDSRTAWIAMRYDDAAGTITYESMAVAPGALNMTAGQTAVPEPAETAAVMALLAGGAAVWRRRKQFRLANAKA